MSFEILTLYSISNTLCSVKCFVRKEIKNFRNLLMALLISKLVLVNLILLYVNNSCCELINKFNDTQTNYILLKQKWLFENCLCENSLLSFYGIAFIFDVATFVFMMIISYSFNNANCLCINYLGYWS